MFEAFGLLPDDEHDRVLAENVHPTSWVNPQPNGRYNIVVLGAGTAGLITAVVSASLGAKVALIEQHLMGGDCLNVGCVPSKGIIRAARAWADLRHAAEFGCSPAFHEATYRSHDASNTASRSSRSTAKPASSRMPPHASSRRPRRWPGGS